MPHRTSNILDRKGTPMKGLTEYLNDPRRAVTADGVVCLLCGQLFRHLTNTHLRRHGLTSESYKVQFGYNGRRALMAPGLRRIHAENALRADLASQIRRQALDEDRDLRRRGGQRIHRLEEKLTRQERIQEHPIPISRDVRGRFSEAPSPKAAALDGYETLELSRLAR